VKTPTALPFAATLALDVTRAFRGGIMPYTTAEFARLQAQDPHVPITERASRCHIWRAEAPIVLTAGRAGSRSVSKG
jgi:hypothetical protein